MCIRFFSCFRTLTVKSILHQKISSEGVQWESEHAFKNIIRRTDNAMKELTHLDNVVSSVNDAIALSMMGELKYL